MEEFLSRYGKAGQGGATGGHDRGRQVGQGAQCSLLFTLLAGTGHREETSGQARGAHQQGAQGDVPQGGGAQEDDNGQHESEHSKNYVNKNICQ